MEIAVALVLLAVSALVMFDSYRLGARWGDDGPQSGYFPFYIGLLLGISSLATLARVVIDGMAAARPFRGAPRRRGAQFVELGAAEARAVGARPRARVRAGRAAHRHLRRVGALHHAVHALARALPWVKSAAIGVAVSASIFVMFEVWFKVPLYKGAFDPLAWLGY